jgi:hypothetical protein
MLHDTVTGRVLRLAAEQRVDADFIDTDYDSLASALQSTRRGREARAAWHKEHVAKHGKYGQRGGKQYPCCRGRMATAYGSPLRSRFSEVDLAAARGRATRCRACLLLL